jgi:HK97 family phage prohead protease
MSNKIEMRILSAKLSLRAADSGTDSPGKLEGYAAVFNSRSEDLGGFYEVMKPGCFDNVLKSKPDVRCLMNHDGNLVLGRTKNGTLQLRADPMGLFYSCQLPNTSTGRDLYALIQRGDISQCSFAFKLEAGDDDWEEDSASGKQLRTIKNVSHLFDVSAVTTPAYEATSVSARNRVAHYHIATPPAPPVVLMTEKEKAQLRGQRFAQEDHDDYLREVAESNRPRTIDPFMDAVRKEQARGNRK